MFLSTPHLAEPARIHDLKPDINQKTTRAQSAETDGCLEWQKVPPSRAWSLNGEAVCLCAMGVKVFCGLLQRAVTPQGDESARLALRFPEPVTCTCPYLYPVVPCHLFFDDKFETKRSAKIMADHHDPTLETASDT